MTPPVIQEPNNRIWLWAVGALVLVAVMAPVTVPVASEIVARGRPKSDSPPAVAPSSPDTNGLEKRSATDVLQEAADSLTTAPSVHVTGTWTNRYDGEPIEVDLRIQGTSSSGTLRRKDTRLEIIKVGGDVYLKGDQQALVQLGGVPAGAAPHLGADQWLKLAAQRLTSIEGFSLEELAGLLTRFESLIEPNVTQTTLDGRNAVVISDQNGSRLYVANTGIAYPLRDERHGAEARQIDFTEYGADFRIGAPPNTVNSSAPGGAEPGPLSGEERRWLQSIRAVHKKIDDAIASLGDELEESEMASFTDTLRSCSRELARSAPPSPRLQPVDKLVKEACQQYDKAAECFSTAVEIWNQPAATEEKMTQLIGCGFDGAASGSRLLEDAELKAGNV